MVPYSIRIPILVALSFAGMQFVAHAPSLWWRMFGVVLASISSGAGELSFLGLTHYYGGFALASWGSGTGAAGLVGGGLYLATTTWWKWSVRGSLAGFSFLPFLMLGAFFMVLPREALKYQSLGGGNFGEEEEEEGERGGEEGTMTDHGDGTTEPLMSSSTGSASGHRFSAVKDGEGIGRSMGTAWKSLKRNLRRSKKLFFP